MHRLFNAIDGSAWRRPTNKSVTGKFAIGH
jgi:hypothetical protein